MIKTVLLLLFCLFVDNVLPLQSNPEKARILIENYIKTHPKLNSGNRPKLGNLVSLKSSYAATRSYKNFQHKIDSLKLEGRKIDAKIPNLKTTLEIDQAKKDSKHLSDQLVTTSDQLIDFMTGYKGTQVGWTVKSINPSQKKTRTFYLDKELTKVTLVK